MRLVRPLTWMAALATIALCAGAVPLALATVGSRNAGPGGALWPIPFTAMAVVGAFVANRRPGNSTGWVLCAAGFMMVGNAFAQSYVNHALTRSPTPPATHFFAWLSFWTWLPASGLIAIVLVLFPTGSPPSRRWRWATFAIAALTGATTVAALPTFGAPARDLLGGPSGNTIPGGNLVSALSQALPLALVVGFVALAVRFRRSRGVERLQLKWFVFGASLVPTATVLMLLIGGADPISTPLGGGSVLAGITAIPVTAGIAILRYRLYDIDRIISRTFSYAVITALLGGVYVGTVYVFGGPLRVVTGGSSLGVAASVLVVAALFRPLQRRVQDLVDRRFNRARYNAAHTIDAFTSRLREEVDIDALGAELAEVVTRTMQPASVSLWLPHEQRETRR